jgi:hypothetical protein
MQIKQINGLKHLKEFLIQNWNICGQKRDLQGTKHFKHDQLFFVKCKLVKHKGTPTICCKIPRGRMSNWKCILIGWVWRKESRIWTSTKNCVGMNRFDASTYLWCSDWRRRIKPQQREEVVLRYKSISPPYYQDDQENEKFEHRAQNFELLIYYVVEQEATT